MYIYARLIIYIAQHFRIVQYPYIANCMARLQEQSSVDYEARSKCKYKCKLA